jgi:undecaprenyl-diphosphatase
MTILDAIILGIVQGLTEFIPISSSGHLILVREWLHINTENGLAFDAVLQLVTACAVLLYFWKDIKRLGMAAIDFVRGYEILENTKLELSALAIATVPAVVFGIILESYMETIFRSVLIVAIMLIMGAALMYLAEFVAKKRGYDENLTLPKAFTIGLFQCLALVPGVSRSGATISGGLLAGLSREAATRFSFLLSFPILFGSGSKKLADILAGGMFNDIMVLFIASAVAFVVGLGAIHLLISYLRNHSLNIFVWYRVALAILLAYVFI